VCAFVLDALLAARGRVALMVGNSNEAAIRMYVGLGLSYRLQEVLRVERRPGGRGRPSVG
jgi:ribosomal protein S18 acetylase RimI-like enzyme